MQETLLTTMEQEGPTQEATKLNRSGTYAATLWR